MFFVFLVFARRWHQRPAAQKELGRAPAFSAVLDEFTRVGFISSLTICKSSLVTPPRSGALRVGRLPSTDLIYGIDDGAVLVPCFRNEVFGVCRVF